MPNISVIVPVYKVEPYLRRCVDSILGQTYTDFELILVDDGSPDNCPAICDEYKEKDSRVTVIHQENGGLSAARNAGIDWAFANSDSQWLSFVDSDDWVHPEYLERLLDAALTNELSVSICGYATTDGEDPIIEPQTLEQKLWITEDFFVEHNVNATIAWGKLYRKNCFKEIRYPLGKIHEDEFTTYKILFAFEKVAVIPAPLYAYYCNPNGIIGSKQIMYKEDKYIALEEQIQYFQKNNFPCACRSQVRIYLCYLNDKIALLSSSTSSHPNFLHSLQKRKRKNLIKYSLLLDPSQDSDGWVLTKIFPKTMSVYWNIRAVLRKLKIIK